MYVYVYYISTCILNINNYPLEYYSIYGLIMQDHTDAWLQWVTQTGVGAGAEKNSLKPLNEGRGGGSYSTLSL